MKNLLYIAIIFVFGLVSCKTDVNINAPYQENMVVIGLLNPDTNYQVIRINKTFLGTGNANTYASNPDSSNYPAGILDVSVDGNKFTDVLINTNDNVFGNKQRIYQCNNFQPAYGKQYSLSVRNTRTGKTVVTKTAITTQKQMSALNTPAPNGLKLLDGSGNPAPEGALVMPHVTNGKIYNAIIRFNYIEMSGTDSIKRFIDFDLGSVTTNDNDASVKIQFVPEQFFKNLQNKIVQGPQYYFYRTKCIEITITIGDDILNNYMLVNAPSSTLNQNKPEYTNLVGGIGIFASRSRRSLHSKFESTTENYFLGRFRDFDLIPR